MCDGFPAAFANVNGNHPLNASHVDIQRHLLSVGYPSRNQALVQVGMWRAVSLIAISRGYLNQNLATTAYFRNVEQSEKASTSFMLGQAFTAWFAAEHLKVPILVHARGTPGYAYDPAAGGVPKPGVGAINPNARPDFIGLDATGYHVFEAKGRSSAIPNGLINHALSQVSIVSTINGLIPKTRVAACFAFEDVGSSGRIVDPIDGEGGQSLKFDPDAVTLKAYSFFLQQEFRTTATSEIPEYLSVSIDGRLRYGIDEEVLDATEALQSTSPEGRDDGGGAAQVLRILDAKRDKYLAARGHSELSIGLDGTMLALVIDD